MITLSNTKINNFLQVTIEKSKKYIDKIEEDINNLKDFSDILDIVSITTIDGMDESYDILYLIKIYETIGKINDYQEYQCPNCKRKDCLHYHKTYERDIVFYIGNKRIEAIIHLLVLECKHCKHDKDEQHFHAIIPDFIFPYHIYSANIILNTIYDRLIKKIKIYKIIEKNRITKELYYKWIRGFKKYSISANTVLGVENNLESIIQAILNDIHMFLYKFYQTYYHPFFLFKPTCVPLSIIP